MSKIRVMHCLGQLNTGGAETLVMNILRKINREEYQFDFLVFNQNKGFYDDEVKQLGSNIYFNPSMTTVGLIQYLKNLISFFKSQNIDIVHSHMDWQGGFIAYAAHKAGIRKIVVHSHANQKMFDSNFKYHVIIELNKYLISKYATDCLACSEEAGQSLFLKEFTVLNNGIDFDKYIHPNQSKIEELKKEFNIKKNEIVLGCVGSLSQNKNQSFLLDVLYELKKTNSNYRLILVGDGNEKETLMNKVNELNLNDSVLFTGVRKEIPEIMHCFDMFLFPSKLEGLGIVGIEAQACGLQCLMSDSIPVEIDMGLGLGLFLNLNKTDWMKEILKINNKNNEIIKFFNSKYCIEKTIEKVNKIYKEN